jgi:hypothetical protein
MGRGPAYFVAADHPPEVCERGRPLSFSNYRIWRIETGDSFDLRARPHAGSYLRSVTAGLLDADPY